MRRTREQLRLASKSTAKLNKSERQVIKRFKQREAERRKLVMANNAEQRKRTRKEIKRNASASHSGRTLALLALERLALAGLAGSSSHGGGAAAEAGTRSGRPEYVQVDQKATRVLPGKPEYVQVDQKADGDSNGVFFRRSTHSGWASRYFRSRLLGITVS